MRKAAGILFFFLVLSSFLFAQNSRYIIRLKDKASNPYTFSNPAAYLSQKSMERRQRYGIPLDSTDLPVTPRYTDSIRSAGAVTILNVSKWLNAVTIQTTDNSALSKINGFPFVIAVQVVAPRPENSGQEPGKFDHERLFAAGAARGLDIEDHFSYGFSENQIRIHEGEFLHNIGLRGQNMVIGMLDAGFRNYLTLPAFDSIRENEQILDTWDFVAGEPHVNEDDPHGMQCFSTIGANIPGEFVGTAPKANFYLYRSEDPFTEYPVEEHNWVCAAERVDSAGGDLISSSLGYNTYSGAFAAFNHSYADMDGNTAMVTIGADLAAKKGILVVNSAGNEGTSSWHYISAPADGDSVLAVGAVNAAGAVAAFSSYGPSADGRVKPDVASVGQSTVVQYPAGNIGTANGTSFSAPNLAGLATCLWQGFREFNNMQIIGALRMSGTIAHAPNDRIGYGIPKMRKATMILLKQFASANASISNCRTILNWTSKDMSAMKYEIERRLSTDTGFIKIAERFGTGSIFSNHSYVYEDILNGAPAGSIQYRVRQVIDTAINAYSADYLDTVTVNLSAVCTVSYESVTLMPNPALNHLKVRIIKAEAIPQLTIRLFNSLGQLIYEKKESKGMGTAYYDIPVYQLASGKYYVVLHDGNKLLATKEMLKLLPAE